MFKYCIVPSCLNSNYNMPNKLFISVPKNAELRKKWCRAVKRESVLFSPKSTLFVCEDHFNLREDLENYVRFSLMGGKLHIKKEVVPHLFPQTRINTSQIDQKVVDTYNENNKRFNKSSSGKQCKTCSSTAGVMKKSKRRRIAPETIQLPNTSNLNSEIREEHIQNNIRINEELDMRENSVSVPIQNDISNNQSVAENAGTECNNVFIKTECEDNNDKPESIIKETGTGSNINDSTNVLIKRECEETDEQMEYNTNDFSNVSIKTECTNTNDNSKTDIECNRNESSNMVIKTEHENTQDNIDRNVEETGTECKINNSSHVIIKNEYINTNESNTNESSSVPIKSECTNSNNISNSTQPSTECNKVDSSNMSFKTECKNINNDCEQSGTDRNVIHVKMECNKNDSSVERTLENNNECQPAPYSNGNIIIVTNGFITTPNADENIIESKILIEETNNIITYSQNEFVSVNDNILNGENTVYEKVCRNGEIQMASPLYDNNKMLSDISEFQCSGNLFDSENWLADWFVTCMVPHCNNTRKYNPRTRFFKSPKDGRWETWLKAIYLNPEIFEHKTTYYICEDHFDLPNDLENWENFQKNREQPRMRPHVLPSPTAVQPENEEEGCRKKKLHKSNKTVLK